IAGTATKMPEECVWTARTAAAVALATHQVDPSRSPSSTNTIVSLTKATASGGFQMVAVSAMSKGAVAAKSVTASASANDAKRFQIATTSTASTADWMIDRPMPPA